LSFISRAGNISAWLCFKHHQQALSPGSEGG